MSSESSAQPLPPDAPTQPSNPPPLTPIEEFENRIRRELNYRVANHDPDSAWERGVLCGIRFVLDTLGEVEAQPHETIGLMREHLPALYLSEDEVANLCDRLATGCRFTNSRLSTYPTPGAIVLKAVDRVPAPEKGDPLGQ